MSDDTIRTIVSPVVAEHGLDLEAVTLTRAGKRSVLQLVVDQDGGVDLDQVAALSRVVSDTLDEHSDVLPPNTVLEVTSPGVDRPLTEERHWRRAAGRLVEVFGPGGTTFTDRVLEVSDGVVHFASGQSIPVGEIDRGIVHVEFTGGPDGH